MSESEVASDDKNVSNDEESDSVSEDKKPKFKRSLKKYKSDVTNDDGNVETSSANKSEHKAAPKGKLNKDKYSKFNIKVEEKGKVPLLDQPAIIEGSRNRKTFVSFESKVTVTKHSPIEIPDGKGVPLGGIPLINCRLKRLRQNVLKELHRTLFGKCGNPANFTVNLQKFHGYPFGKDSDEYKRKLTLFNKFHMVDVKELLFLLDLDMKVKKKEEALKQVLDFLLCPKPTENTQIVQSFGHPKRKATKRNYHEADADDENIKRKKKAKANAKASKGEDAGDNPVQRSHIKKIKPKATKSTKMTPDEDDSDKEEEQESDDNNELKKPAKKRKRNQVIEEHEDSLDGMKLKKKKSTDTKSNNFNKKSAAGKKSSKNEENSTSELTDDELKTFLKKVLSDANLEETTMKTVYGLISSHYPNYNFSKKKDFIKDVVKSLIQS